jgi:hypothetical protein
MIPCLGRKTFFFLIRQVERPPRAWVACSDVMNHCAKMWRQNAWLQRQSTSVGAVKNGNGCWDGLRARVTRWACEKIAQNIAQRNVCQNYETNYFYRRSPKILIHMYFKKILPIVRDTPIGENSPNLVTLLGAWQKIETFPKRLSSEMSSLMLAARTRVGVRKCSLQARNNCVCWISQITLIIVLWNLLFISSINLFKDKYVHNWLTQFYAQVVIGSVIVIVIVNYL